MPDAPFQRLHIVLVPGFAGFDALGQLEYYAGVTPQFRRWKKSDRRKRHHVVLHYFDNFPTAAVGTRAQRLRDYLGKRITRGEFLPDDALALVGHSTGGLDIRRLLRDLDERATADSGRYCYDGDEKGEFAVPAGEILRMIKAVVFLSVPQWGTNIADWVRAHTLGRKAVIAELRASVTSSQLPLLNKLQDFIGSSAADTMKLGLFYALQDALSEAQAGNREAATPDLDERMRMVLDAQEAASALELYLRHTASDFRAINDLAAEPPAGDRNSPAHYDWEMRRKEIASWDRFDIKTRSYATMAYSPFHFEAGRAVPRWDLLQPWTYPECNERKNANGTDVVYRYCYRACAGGPFAKPFPNKIPMPKAFVGPLPRRIELWDNDGIVNTASMLWPNYGDTKLVRCDHMDIVGHFEPVEATEHEFNETGRKFRAYDLLGSASKFYKNEFAQVWTDVLDFCAASSAGVSRKAAGAAA